MASLSPAVPDAPSVRALRSKTDLQNIEHEWAELWERDPAATPFQSPDWLLPWVAHLWGGGKLRVVEVREGDRLRGVLPLFLWGYGRRPDRITLSLLGSGISDYLGMICDPARCKDAGRAAMEWILANGEWRVCDLQDLTHDSPLPAGSDGAECSACPVLPLRRSIEEQLAHADAKFRRNLIVAQKRLHAAGRVEFVETDETAREPLMRELFRLHGSRWRGGGMLATAALQSFHMEVAQRFGRRGMLRLFGLYLDGECIAVQYNFAAKGRAYLYLSGFDENWRRVSPGMVLLAHAIQCAIEEGLSYADFLRKPEEFKYAWGARDEMTRRIFIER